MRTRPSFLALLNAAVSLARACVCSANAFIDGLGIREYANRQSRHLSGGTKRKVSFAMAMIGNPQVVFLDEPSTGCAHTSHLWI